MARWRTWRVAMADALYGPEGFYHRAEGGPGHHFRTSSSASLHFARAVVRLAARVDESLGRPDRFDLVEVAAARGALLSAVAHVVHAEAPGLAPRLRLTGIELAARPDGLPLEIGWSAEIPPLTGLLLANEWLDNVPLDVVEQTDDGLRLVEVSDDGEERLGSPVNAADQAWVEMWWPGLEDEDRAEVGAPRDEAWTDAVRRLESGVAVTADYAHLLEERAAGLHAGGTLSGYRDGRQVLAVPDGACDLTAHVALDAVAAAGTAAGATSSLLTDQRTVLRGLGVSAARPDQALSTSDPMAYLRSLENSGQEAELIARGGLGDFGWLLQARGVEADLLDLASADNTLR